MYHKISSMCDKVRVIYEKAEELRIMKYGHKDDVSKKADDSRYPVAVSYTHLTLPTKA